MEDIGHISLVGSLGLLVFLMDALGLSLSVDDGLEGGGDVQEGTVSGVLKGMSLSFELVAQSKVILFQLNSRSGEVLDMLGNVFHIRIGIIDHLGNASMGKHRVGGLVVRH